MRIVHDDRLSLSVDTNGKFYAINVLQVLAGYLCGNDHNTFQKFSAAMD